MARRRALYSFVMVTIYVVATMLSSLSLLLCEHHHPHHPHHHAECHHEGCNCENEVTIGPDCCDHHHPILGDNHTDYIDSSHRSDSRASHAVALMLLPMVVDNISGEQALEIYASTLQRSDLDFALPDVAYLSSVGLRAPPMLA